MEYVLLKNVLNHWHNLFFIAIVFFISFIIFGIIYFKAPKNSDTRDLYKNFSVVTVSMAAVAISFFVYFAYVLTEPVIISYKVGLKSELNEYRSMDFEPVKEIPADSLDYYIVKYGSIGSFVPKK